MNMDTTQLITLIIAAISSGAFSTFLTIAITARQTLRKAAAQALAEEAGAVKKAIEVWQQTVDFLSGRVTTLEGEVEGMRRERTESIIKTNDMLKSITDKDWQIATLIKEISTLNDEIITLKNRIIVLEEKLLR